MIRQPPKSTPFPYTTPFRSSDNCDSNPSISYVQSRVDGNCPSNYTLSRTWTATDACGNHSSQSQDIHSTHIKSPELHSAPADLSVECDAVPSAASPTASDNC